MDVLTGFLVLISFILFVQGIYYKKHPSEFAKYFPYLYKFAIKIDANLKGSLVRWSLLTILLIVIFTFLLFTKNGALTKAQKQASKLASKELLLKIKEEKDKVMVVDWHKNQRQQINVDRYIKTILYNQLKEVYDNKTFKEKSTRVYNYFFDLAENGGELFA